MRVAIRNNDCWLCPHCGLGDCEPVPPPGQTFWALQWLSRYQHDPLFMAALRRLCTELGCGGPGDAAVLRQTAAMLASGRLHLCKPALAGLETPVGRTAAGAMPPENADAPEIIPAAPRPRPVAAPVAEPPTFLPNADLLAIAEAQKEAAKMGVPFCEECMKAKLARDRAAAGASR